MKKKLIALAVAGATFAPAVMAQTANPVTLYGRVWVMANSMKADTGATTLSTRTTIVDESSLIGIRGTEDLGGGLKAWFQVESSAPPDAGGGTFGSRNSGVGLQGGFGSIMLGRWDTPFKLSAIFVDPYGQNTIGNQLSVVNTGDFNRRESNVIQYWTPNLNGFSGRFMYGANEGKVNAIPGRAAVPANPVTFTPAVAAVPAVPAANPSNISLSLDYAAGPFRINYAYEKHKDTRGGVLTSGAVGSVVTGGVTEKGQNLSATFVFGPFKLGALAQKFDATDRTERKAYFVAGTYTMGMHEFMGSYGRNRDGAPPDTPTVRFIQPLSKQVAIGYNYNFSKRTTFMARYATMVNNAGSFNPMNASGLPALAPNNDPKGFGAGFRHTF